MIKVFWLEPTQMYRHSIRRYSAGDEKCAAKPYGMSCHDARIELGIVEAEEYPVSYASADDDADAWKSDRVSRADPRWPTACVCGYRFNESDPWRVDYDKQYQALGGPHDGSLFSLRDAPPGAMWDASWFREGGGGESWTGPDGLSLVVQLPNGSSWCVDQEASNCTRTQYGPGEYVGGDGVARHADKMWLGRTHYCWVRHGNPRAGDVHVDKNGETCAAGAGSILSGNYHGFLHNGFLTL